MVVTLVGLIAKVESAKEVIFNQGHFEAAEEMQIKIDNNEERVKMLSDALSSVTTQLEEERARAELEKHQMLGEHQLRWGIGLVLSE